MDLNPFNNINPCGYAKLQMTQISEYVDHIQMHQVTDLLTKIFLRNVTEITSYFRRKRYNYANQSTGIVIGRSGEKVLWKSI